MTTLDPGELHDDLGQRREDAIAAQRHAATAPAPLAIIACPGAGKTRIIVDRHCATPPGQPTGRAIVSFTKVAAAQIHARAAEMNRLDLVEHPHVVTTLDGFFWRFLVRPFLGLPAAGQLPWQRLESWRQAPRAHRTFSYQLDPQDPKSPRYSFDLAEFTFHLGPSDRFPTPNLSGKARMQRGRSKLTDEQIDQVYRRAASCRHELVNTHHLFTGAETRRAAIHYLGRYREEVAAMLPGRFIELIVDEAQDCSQADVYLLKGLADVGLPLVLVADPDQAIYGFRGADYSSVRDLLEAVPQRIITGNWRSSATICATTATLRAEQARQKPDVTLADHHNAPHPIYLYSCDDVQESITQFAKVAEAAGIATSERMILSYATATLPGIGKAIRNPPSHPAAALAWATGILRSPSADQRARDHAEEVVHASIVRFWLPGADNHAITDMPARYDIDPHALRRAAATARDTLPDLTVKAGQWCDQARQILSSTPPQPGLTVPQGINLTAPNNASGSKIQTVAGLGSKAFTEAAGRYANIHQVKGEEAHAVLVLLPDEDRTDWLLDLWTAGATGTPAPAGSQADTAEARRVLYVAATRA